jgi:choline-glycine betaine transporter
MKPNWQNSRDIILFFGGLAGVFNETVLTSTERPTLLILFAAMMGLPAFLRQDEKNGNGKPPPDSLSQQESRAEEAQRRLDAKRKAIRDAMRDTDV